MTCIINQFNPLDELRPWGQSFFGDWAQVIFGPTNGYSTMSAPTIPTGSMYGIYAKIGGTVY